MYITNYKRQNSNLSVHRQTTTLCNTTKPHGKARKKTISRAIYYQINSLLRRQGTQTELTSTSEWDHFSEVKINDNVYSSTSYKRSKRSSNTIQVANNIFDFGTIHEFIGEQDTLFAIVNTWEIKVANIFGRLLPLHIGWVGGKPSFPSGHETPKCCDIRQRHH